MEKEGNQNKVAQMMCVLILSVVAVMAQPKKDFSVNGLGLVDTDALEEEYGFLGNNDKVYICETWVSSAVEEAYGAWQVPPRGFMDHCIPIGSWLVNHPMMNKLQAELGCENPYRALYENENVYYIRSGSTEDIILEYLQENYDEKITCEYIKKKGDFKVYKYKLGDD